MRVASLIASSAVGSAEERCTENRGQIRVQAPPDITSFDDWSGACVVATAWAVLVLYAASRGLG